MTAQLSWLVNALENALDDQTAKAEEHLTKLLENPALQKVAEQGIASLDQTEKDALMALIESALDVLPPALKDTLTQFVEDVGLPLPPTGNLIWSNPNTSVEVLTGTSGVSDIFVVDFSERQVDGNTTDGIANVHIVGFESGLDVLAFINVPSGVHFGDQLLDPRLCEGNVACETFFLGPINQAASLGINNDPSIPDTLLYFNNGFELALWDRGETYSPSSSADNTVTLIDGSELTLPPNPWLLG